jgi:endonuclease/exonuclease/phosphatase family metal-dependent hydrolase
MVGTWNCFGQGQNAIDAIFGRRAPRGARLKHDGVIRECASADVLCVQELLSGEACDFFDRLKGHAFTSLVRDHNRAHFRTATMRGTGLGIGSRFSHEEHTFMRFSTRAAGWDRLARKGALHVRIAGAEKAGIDVFTVHLQAGTGASSIAIRARQLEELSRFIQERNGGERRIVVCGDFNIDGRAPVRDDKDGEYGKLRAALVGLEDLGARDDLPTCGAERLDYIFTRGFSTGSIGRMLDRSLDSDRDDDFASDHFGLVAQLREE